MKKFAKSIIMTGVVLSVAFGQRRELKPVLNKVSNGTIPVRTSHGKRALAVRLVLERRMGETELEDCTCSSTLNHITWQYYPAFDASTNPLASNGVAGKR